ncbi:MAG: hypothetical protein GX433_17915 [Deltaproteobacteria bacterium]|nr:hypothetical protein [Deltaproteobacteria bacterium]
MRLEILTAESLGTRGLCCRVETYGRVIVIDPGVALGAWRYRLPPHPVQIAVGKAARKRIVEALERATDVVFSHYHGDHVPLTEANPYQLSFLQLPPRFTALRAWSKSPEGQTQKSQTRACDLMNLLGGQWRIAEGLEEGPLIFSRAVPHGVGGPALGEVMMTRVELGGCVFVHGSDIQFLDKATVDVILGWTPDIVLAAGPPLYQRRLNAIQRAYAWSNALRLAKKVGTLILDHHLLRSVQGMHWLQALSQAAGKRIYCAADFMGRPRRLLEAERQELYATMPVRTGWHEDYTRGLARMEDFPPVEPGTGPTPDRRCPDR